MSDFTDKLILQPPPPFEYQRRHFDLYKDSQYLILCWPTGSGKSKELQMLALHKLEHGYTKVIYVVPQNIIGSSIKKASIIDFGDKKLPWKPEIWSGSGVQDIKKFFDSEPNKAGSILVTTHQALSLANPSSFADCVVIIDEGHHVNLGTVEDQNRLSEIVDKVLNSGTNACLILATATFSRGDGVPILDDDQRAKFDVSNVSFSEYWSSLQNLREFSYNFVFYSAAEFTTVLSAIIGTAADPRILVYIPAESSKYLRNYDKDHVTRLVESAILERCGGYKWSPASTEPGAIVDLVNSSEGYRDAAIEFIRSHPNNVKAILTCGMFKEGADWRNTNIIIDLTPSRSSTERKQKFGRGTRDNEGKTRFDYYIVLPSLDAGDDNYQELCNEYYGYLMFSLVDFKFPGGGVFDDLPFDMKMRLMRRIAVTWSSGGFTETDESISSVIEAVLADEAGINKDEIAYELRTALGSLPRCPSGLMDQLGLGNEIINRTVLGAIREFASSNGGLTTFRKYEEFSAKMDYIDWVYNGTDD